MSIIEYILGSLFRIIFFLLLLIYHPLQMLSYNLFGWKAHQKIVTYLNGSILTAFRIPFNSISGQNTHNLPENTSAIIIANHQSLWDIVGLYWYLRKVNPVFVSKIELAKGIPSISYNLRKSGAALIARKNRRQAITEISRLSKQINKQRRAAVIFPEGTRSRDGQVKNFALGGITVLLKKNPDAWIIPVAIQGTCKMEANKYYRIKGFNKVSWTVLKPFNASGMDAELIAGKCEQLIKGSLGQS